MNKSDKNKIAIFLVCVLFCFIWFVIGYSIGLNIPLNNSQSPDTNHTGNIELTNTTTNMPLWKGYDTNNLSMYNSISNVRETEMPYLQVNTPEPALIIYRNGTIWVREGQEKQVGEQLAKIGVAYSSYRDGFCEGASK